MRQQCQPGTRPQLYTILDKGVKNKSTIILKTGRFDNIDSAVSARQNKTEKTRILIRLQIPVLTDLCYLAHTANDVKYFVMLLCIICIYLLLLYINHITNEEMLMSKMLIQNQIFVILAVLPRSVLRVAWSISAA